MLRLLLACNWILMLMALVFANSPSSFAMIPLGVIGVLKATSRLAGLGILSYLAVRSWSDPRRTGIVKHMLPWACYSAWAVASTIWSPLLTFSLGQSVSLVVVVALAYCTAVYARRMADVSQVLKHLCLALLLLGAGVLAFRLLAPGSLSLSRSARGFFHPTNASAAASFGMILIIWARLSMRWPWSRWLLWPSLTVHGATLVLANNRASLLITLVVVLGVVLAHVSAGWGWLLLTSVSFACAAYVMLDPGFLFVDRAGGTIAQYVSRDQSSQQLAALSGREEMWGAIWESFLGSPWLGHGYAVSSDTGELHVWYVWTNWTAHNFWLQVLVSTGIVGAVLIAWGLISYAFRLVYGGANGVGLRRLVFLGAALLVWQSAWGLTNESFVGPLQPESIVFFAVLGLVTGRFVRGGAKFPSSEDVAQLAVRSRRVFSGPTMVLQGL